MPVIPIIGAVASVAGAAASIITGSKAAKAQRKAGDRAIASQEKALERSIALSEPFRKGGLGALDLLNQIFVEGDTGKIQELPGISFLREQGEQAIGRFQAARGNFLSGAALKEGIRFNQGLASTNLQQATAPLTFLAAQGQAAAAGQAAQVGQTGANVANIQLGQGQAKAAGIANIGSSINTGINNVLFSLLSGGVFGQNRNTQLNPSSNRSGTFNTIFGGQF